MIWTPPPSRTGTPQPPAPGHTDCLTHDTFQNKTERDYVVVVCTLYHKTFYLNKTLPVLSSLNSFPFISDNLFSKITLQWGGSGKSSLKLLFYKKHSKIYIYSFSPPFHLKSKAHVSSAFSTQQLHSRQHSKVRLTTAQSKQVSQTNLPRQRRNF